MIDLELAGDPAPPGLDHVLEGCVISGRSGVFTRLAEWYLAPAVSVRADRRYGPAS